jgi:Uma2 family endonuclease
MTAPVRVRVSEEEYLATMTGEKPSLEFVNGEVFQKPMTKKDYQDVSKRIVALMYELERRKLGYFAWETTTNLSEGVDRRYRVPDIAFWASGRAVAQPDNVYLPPTLAVEIRSEGQSMASLQEKCREYRSRGVDVCWLIDPTRRTVEVFEDGREGVELAADGVLASEKIPGFSLPIVELWAGF